MKIALVSKLWESTSPNSRGGTGVSVGQLADELVHRGHTVTLFATGDSKTKATLVSCRKKPWGSNYSEPIEYLNIAQAFSKKRAFDIINCHVEHKAALFADAVDTPTLLTLRYGEFFRDELQILRQYRRLNWSFNSRALQKKYSFLSSRGVIHNGLNVKRYPFEKRRGSYLLFLSRLSPQKAPHMAIAAANTLDMRLILAGKRSSVDDTYLKKYVTPHLKRKNIRYVGEVGFARKIQLLKNASALIHPNDPSMGFEACSNAILEAQACGTPAIASANGSNRELIQQGKTGYIVRSLPEMCRAIKKSPSLDRQACRDHISSQFTVAQMADGYEMLYKKIARLR